MKKLIILLVVLGIFVTGCGKNNSNELNNKVDDKLDIKMIEPTEVRRISDAYLDDGNIKIIDVRTKEEYEEGHIKNAINVPLDTINDIDFSKDNEIIVYCQSGNRSYQAAIILNDLGYTVKDMGGLNNWNYELED